MAAEVRVDSQLTCPSSLRLADGVGLARFSAGVIDEATRTAGGRIEPETGPLRSFEAKGVPTKARLQMADNWTHDRPVRTSRKARRVPLEQQPRLELPVPAAPETREADAQPVPEPERGIAFIDFYV